MDMELLIAGVVAFGFLGFFTACFIAVFDIKNFFGKQNQAKGN